MQQQMEERRVAPPQLTSQEMANLVAFLSAYQFYLSQLGKPGDPVKGMQVFKDKHCTTCHALKPGDEGGKPGPNLHGYTRLSPIQIAQAMWNHGPAMADHFSAMSLSQPQFTGVEMADLIAYLQRAAAPVDGEPAYVEPGSPNNGRALFNDKGCVRCHAIRGVGGSSDAPDLGKRREEFVRSVTEVAGLMWNHGGAMWQKMQQLKLPAVEFKGNEMADIIAYLYFINYFDKPGEPDLGRELFRKKGCVHCHAMDKDSIKICPNLADSPAVGSPIDTISAMWNHARQMEPAMRAKGIPWPKFEPGEMADLVEYIRIQREKKQAAP
jgi:mono/diheme cytochrome c family protein